MWTLTNGPYISVSPLTQSVMISAKAVRLRGMLVELAAGKNFWMNFKGGMLPKKWPCVSMVSRLLRLGLRCFPESYGVEPDVLRDIGVCGTGRVLDCSGVFGFAYPTGGFA